MSFQRLVQAKAITELDEADTEIWKQSKKEQREPSQLNEGGIKKFIKETIDENSEQNE